MVDIKKEFCTEFNSIQRKSDVGLLPGNNRDCNFAFAKFYPVIRYLQENKYERGIDFGCGNCSLLILGKLCGIHFKGVDVFTYRKKINRYASLQKHMIELGYDITIYDGGLFPVKGEGEYDFLTSYLSMNDDMTSNSNVNHLDAKNDIFYKRMISIVRNLKDGGLLYIGPKKKYDVMIKCIQSHKDLSNEIAGKNLKFKLWPQKKSM